MRIHGFLDRGINLIIFSGGLSLLFTVTMLLISAYEQAVCMML